MHTYFIEVKSYIDRKLVAEQQRAFVKSRIWMLENVYWVQQKERKWKQNLISLRLTTEMLPERNLISCTKHTYTNQLLWTYNTKLKG